jgi:hypothetical protein
MASENLWKNGVSHDGHTMPDIIKHSMHPLPSMSQIGFLLVDPFRQFQSNNAGAVDLSYQQQFLQ